MDVIHTTGSDSTPRVQSHSKVAVPIAAHSISPVFMLVGLALVLAFSPLILEWIRFGAKSEQFSYTLLIPVISAYFYWMERQKCIHPAQRSLALTLSFGTIGLALLLQAFRVKAISNGPPNDFLFYSVISFAFVLAALAGWFQGAGFLRAHWFPFTFLFLAAPFPHNAVELIEKFLQAGSAEVTAIIFHLVNVPFLREGTFFQLPGLAIRVAQECSGINSTLVLFVTGILSARLLLSAPWSRAVILASLLPLALTRNAIRIVTISWLTIYYDPNVISGPLHHRGGPVFFVMSLVMLLALILILRKVERKRPPTTDDQTT